MKKLSLSFGLVLTLLSSLVFAPMKVHAGQAVVQGTATDSSSFSGSFSPSNQSFSTEFGATIQPAPNANVSVVNGQITISQEVQNNVNSVASSIINQNITVGTPGAIVLALLQEGADGDASKTGTGTTSETGRPSADVAKTQMQATLISLGASPTLVAQLLDKVSGLLSGSNVNITQLSAAINTWNQIVNQLSPEGLQQIANNPELGKLGGSLKDLRAALKKG